MYAMGGVGKWRDVPPAIYPDSEYGNQRISGEGESEVYPISTKPAVRITLAKLRGSELL